MTRSRFWIAAALLLAACGGTRSGNEAAIEPDKEKLIDALTLFVEAVQGDRFDQAMGYLTSEEQARMREGAGAISPSVERRLKALRLSTLANKPGVGLRRGKLEGIYPWLPNVDHTPGASSTSRDIPPPLP